MKLKPALRKSRPDGFQHRPCLFLTPAVYDGIVSISLERIVRKGPLHPRIERIMQEEIRQERACNTALRGAFRPLKEGTIRTFDRGTQPPANVQMELSVATYFDGPLIRDFDGLPASASRVL